MKSAIELAASRGSIRGSFEGFTDWQGNMGSGPFGIPTNFNELVQDGQQVVNAVTATALQGANQAGHQVGAIAGAALGVGGAVVGHGAEMMGNALHLSADIVSASTEVGRQVVGTLHHGAQVLQGGTPAKKSVFVIHGRELLAWEAMRDLLVALSLHPKNFEIILQTEKFDTASPSTHDIVSRAVGAANGIIVLCTPDEYARLHADYNSPYERGQDRWQTRPNVMYEAGMAFALNPRGTFFVTVGPQIRLFSDVDAFYPVRLLRDDVSMRREIIGRLRSANVDVEEPADGSWKHAGNFRMVLERLGRDSTTRAQAGAHDRGVPVS